ncbi:hypothetical protein [Microcoleus sp. B9-D4]|uniref:hypothetical protein n=1 Tax=Microcoleus sp. B9-D4 TaxID=2818711 RepID=UPI002FD119FF
MIAITPEQTALIPIYREQWRQIGLSIAQIDRSPASDSGHQHRLQGNQSKIENRKSSSPRIYPWNRL